MTLNETQIISLFELADKAKYVEEYDLANTIFALIASVYLERKDHDTPPMRVDLETADVDGICAREVYYDLFVVRYKEYSLNIPAPLVNPNAAICLMKSAVVIDRREHNREHRPTNDGEIEEMWKVLFSMFHIDVVAESGEDILDNDEIDNILLRCKETE